MALGPLVGSWTLARCWPHRACFTSAGVVLNDVFDLETDRRGAARAAAAFGPGVARARHGGSVGGCWCWACCWAAGTGFFVGHLRPGIVAALLATCILLYDAWLKRTPLGPLAMGACRMLNVLLGMSALDAPLHAEHWLVAGGIGVYVAGVTWFARREVGRKRPRSNSPPQRW